jgi:hypothetical protein
MKSPSAWTRTGTDFVDDKPGQGSMQQDGERRARQEQAESSELGATVNIELGRSELVGRNELDVSFLYCCKGVLFV